MITLAPVIETTGDFDDLEKKLARLFFEEIYLPLFQTLDAPARAIRNSMDSLVEAISSGRIRYHDGGFVGTFDASVSRELKKLGAKWDRRKSSWRIALTKLPVEASSAVFVSYNRFQEMITRLDRQIDKILPEEIAEKFHGMRFFDHALFKTDKRIKKTMKDITVLPDLPPERRALIAEEYTQNMRLYIKDWTRKEIVALRKTVERVGFQGQRYEGLVKGIQRRYGVSQNKAKFLARQETALLMTKYKQSRYQDAGVNSYRWQTVTGTPQHPVRPAHKALKGKIFQFDDPPITTAPGESPRRNNPGQDYNCRCFAIPIVKFTK